MPVMSSMDMETAWKMIGLTEEVHQLKAETAIQLSQRFLLSPMAQTIVRPADGSFIANGPDPPMAQTTSKSRIVAESIATSFIAAKFGL
jgi:hypothetical protein